MASHSSLMSRAKTRRLLVLMGATLAVVMVVQHFELPTGIVLPSILFGGNSSSFPSRSSSTFQMLDNKTVPISSNSTRVGEIHETKSSSSDSSNVDKITAQENISAREAGGLGNNHAQEDSRRSDNGFGLVPNGTAPDDHAEDTHGSILDNGQNVEKAMAPGISFKDASTDVSPSPNTENEMSKADSTIPSPALSPIGSFSGRPFQIETRSQNPVVSVNFTSSEGKDAAALLPHDKGENSTLPPSNSAIFKSNSTSRYPKVKTKKSRKAPSRVFSISQMNGLLFQSRSSNQLARSWWPSEVDQEVLFAKSEIEKAADLKNDTGLYAPIYRNASTFERSYELMENMLKVYIYKDGEKPIFHKPLLEGLYASEGWFMKHMEANEKFVTEDPRKAHLFYIPFSSRLLELTLYARHSHSRKNLIQFMANYANMLAANYPFWNRTGGADHFLAACHDWAPAETRGLLLNSIRALCNADIEVGFRIGKDVSLPETYVRSAQNPLSNFEGNPPSQRPFLAFFAGNVHGYVRPILLEYWENKDPDMKIYGPMPHTKGNTNYIQHMKSSKYCICPRGFEVNSPRIVEAIYFECIPVIISDNYVPPFFEVLNWESFAVFIPENDIANLKNILLSISDEQYTEMHKRVKNVQRHFLWHPEPVKYDLFHMILHSVWYNRVFQFRPA